MASQERLNQLVLEMRDVLTEMCKYTEEEVEERQKSLWGQFPAAIQAS